MENQQSLGIDGLPIEYYKEFYEYLKDDPKKTDINDPILNDLKRWRLISLLCLDYKILTKILANRLQTLLPDIISEEQNALYQTEPSLVIFF